MPFHFDHWNNQTILTPKYHKYNLGLVYSLKVLIQKRLLFRLLMLRYENFGHKKKALKVFKTFCFQAL